MHPISRSTSHRGASMTEFLIVAPVLVLLGLGALQIGLIYHGKSIVNYATFEAARTGAVNHALTEPMRHELGTRLAPLVGGDGSMAKAAAGIAIARAEIDATASMDGRPKPRTELEIINPTAAAFADWGYRSVDAGRRVIPNSHLRHTDREDVRGSPPLSLADANLLKIEVTHGLELKVPLVNGLLTKALTLADPENAAWYAANRLPLKAVATVRMQSEAWVDAIEPSPPAAVPDAGEGALDVAGGVAPPGEAGESDRCGTSTGLPSSPVILSSADYENGNCGVVDTGIETSGPPMTSETVDGGTGESC